MDDLPRRRAGVGVEVAPDGAVWFAGNSPGVTRYLPATDSWQDYTMADGLPKLTVTAIAAGPAGDAWVIVPWEVSTT